MAQVYRHYDGQAFAADLRPDAVVSLELLPDVDYGVLQFRDETDLFRVIAPFPVFAQLVTVIRSAGLAGEDR
jgi:hypothetical protein